MILLEDSKVIGAGKTEVVARGSMYNPATHAVLVKVTGSPTAVTVRLLGGIDENSGLTTIVEHAFTAGELTATEALFYLADAPMFSVAASLTVLTGGTAPTVSIYYSAGN